MNIVYLFGDDFQDEAGKFTEMRKKCIPRRLTILNIYVI